jgi:hypothetical protein
MSKILFRSFGINEFYYQKPWSFFERCKYIYKSILILKNIKNINTFCKIRIKKIDIGLSSYDSFMRYTRNPTAKKVNFKLIIYFAEALFLSDFFEKIFIFNHFNEYPIEVLIKYRTNDKNSRFLQSGWNIHSIAKIKRYFERVGFKIKQHKFRPIKGIKRHRKDPVRSWTFKNDKKENLITNGLSILQNQFWLEIYR